MTPLINIQIYFNPEDKKYYYEIEAKFLPDEGKKGPFETIFIATNEAMKEIPSYIIALEYSK